MQKLIPILYFAFGFFILFDGIAQFVADKELYRIIFSWTTENKYTFILVKTLFAVIFFLGGYRKFQLNKQQ